MSVKGLTWEEGNGQNKESLQQFEQKIDPDLNLGCVIGQKEIVSRLRDLAAQIRASPIYEAWGCKPPRGLIFNGPPGTGKSFTAKCLANEIDGIFIELRYQDIASHYVDKSIELLKKIRRFIDREALTNSIIVFMDEIDAFIPSRALHDIHEMDRKRVNFFLTWMSGSLHESQRLTFIGATNRIDIIDPAALRAGRFTEHFEFKPLLPREVIECLEMHFGLIEKKIGRCLHEFEDKEKLLKDLSSMSGADVEQLVQIVLYNQAKKYHEALKPLVDKMKMDNPELKEKEILFTLVRDSKTVLTLKESLPSLIGQEEILDAVRDYSSKRTSEKTSRQIGFK